MFFFFFFLCVDYGNFMYPEIDVPHKSPFEATHRVLNGYFKVLSELM